MAWEELDRRTALKQFGLAVFAAGLGSLPVGQQTAWGADVQDLLRALPEGQLPNDARLGPLKDLNGYFPFQPLASKAAWEQRAEAVRRQILVACGLWPMPEARPIEAVVHGKVEREGYSVERVYFESAPGLYVTGSLYRPTHAEGRRPTILCPHGHWANGRFFDHGAETVQKEIESGAEKFPVSGRYPLQARCVQLVRMGCIVFHYDMLGYADSAPFTQFVTHGMREQREALKDPNKWGLFSAQADLRLLNAMGLQTFNSIRVLDWITTRDDVDPQRLGVTGASGGGTQTFILAAVDARPAAAFPAVMVSTAMQGGCTCENAPYLRVETGNIEFAAMCAPRPLGMSAANDWTVDLETKGLPEIKQLYDMLGVPERVTGKYFPFGHNYNYVSRAMMYEFFNQHLKLGADSSLVEQDFVPLTKDELTVWTAEHPKPACDEQAELAMLRAWDQAAQRQLATLVPADSRGWPEYRRVVGGAFDVMVGRPLPAAGETDFEPLKEEKLDGFHRMIGLLRHKPRGEELPTAFLLPQDWKGMTVYWLDPAGKSCLFQADGSLQPHIAELVRAGVAVGSADLLHCGEFQAGGGPLLETRRVENPRQIAAYTLGYNHSLFAQRAHDVLSLVSFARHHEWKPKKVCVVGVGEAALWAAAAGVPAGAALDKLAFVGTGFRFASVTEIRDPQMWPGAVKYGDVPGLLAANAPRPLWIAGEGTEPPTTVASCYRAAGAPQAVVMDRGSAANLDQAGPMFARLNQWLLA